MDSNLMSMREEIQKGLEQAEEDLRDNGEWERWWQFCGSMQAMTKAGAFGLMLALKRGLAYSDNKEDYLQQVKAKLNIDPGTADRYIRVVELYEREDFQGLDEPVQNQLQSLPVQWQVRVMQSLGDEVLTPETVSMILAAGSFEELNYKLRERKGSVVNREGFRFSISTDGEVYGWFNGEILEGGPLAVWMGRKDGKEYTEFLKRLGIRS